MLKKQEIVKPGTLPYFARMRSIWRPGLKIRPLRSPRIDDLPNVHVLIPPH
jgi:hypothetical protein